ncbi:hypothetical protein DAPPUDRAFT_247819 [Daphnia pulex]|uniref:Uncharacterized protein n=1 Tax=Daphnia pulex TaxID=6669 RepID=E9GSY4_DAPPU|nr:hypothetical protein DAPPUDRAFT_247819 [Daphnia pulex]|eukprot:EFX77271.1 hypothetical protein DAPPUDRAFT_247819 [Daphnia pulex]
MFFFFSAVLFRSELMLTRITTLNTTLTAPISGMRKASDGKEVIDGPATELAKSSNDEDFLSILSDSENYDVIERVVLTLLADDWNSQEAYGDIDKGLTSEPSLMLNVLKALGRTYAQKEGEKLNEGRIQQLVRDARKKHAREFRVIFRDNEQEDEVVPDIPTVPQIQENDGITLKQHIDRLQTLVNYFTL